MKKLTLIFKQNPEVEFDFEVEDDEAYDFSKTDKISFNTIDSHVEVDKNSILLVITKDIDE